MAAFHLIIYGRFWVITEALGSCQFHRDYSSVLGLQVVRFSYARKLYKRVDTVFKRIWQRHDIWVDRPANPGYSSQSYDAQARACFLPCGSSPDDRHSSSQLLRA
jgi:hypothetical protein